MKSVRRMAAVAAAGVMAVALAGGCGGGSSTGTMKKDLVETLITADAAIATRIVSWTVTCPRDLTGKVGTTMTCTLVNRRNGVGTGNENPVTVTITKIDSKGGVHFSASAKGIPGLHN